MVYKSVSEPLKMKQSRYLNTRKLVEILCHSIFDWRCDVFMPQRYDYFLNIAIMIGTF